MFDLRRMTQFCLEKRLSKHKMTMFSKNFGAWPLWPLPGYAYGCNSVDPWNLWGVRQSPSHGKHSGAVPPQFFLPPHFLATRKIYFKHILKQNYCPQKNVFCPSNLETWLRGCVGVRRVTRGDMETIAPSIPKVASKLFILIKRLMCKPRNTSVQINEAA